MVDKLAVDAVFKRMAGKGLMDLPSVDGDLGEFARKIREELENMAPQEILDQFVADIAAGMIPTITGTLPQLGRPGMISISQQVDWEINAYVTRKPPYRAVVSTNLVFFLSTMIHTLMSGMAITFTDDDGNPESRHEAQPVVEVARRLKEILDSFMADQTVPRSDADSTGGRHIMQFRLFHCALSSVVGHELGHIVVAESRLARRPAPFEDFCTEVLENHFEQLLADPRFAPELGPLDERQRVVVFDNWLTELNSDILGASLSCSHQMEHGVCKGAPDVIAFVKFALHLGFMAQVLLQQYMNLFEQGAGLASRTHPPLDFRMHNLLLWMYRDRVQEAVTPIVEYVQTVFAEVLRQAGGDMSVWEASR